MLVLSANVYGGGVELVTDDDQKFGFINRDSDPREGKARFNRVMGTQNGSQFGGYMVVLLGS